MLNNLPLFSVTNYQPRECKANIKHLDKMDTFVCDSPILFVLPHNHGEHVKRGEDRPPIKAYARTNQNTMRFKAGMEREFIAFQSNQFGYNLKEVLDFLKS